MIPKHPTLWVRVLGYFIHQLLTVIGWELLGEKSGHEFPALGPAWVELTPIDQESPRTKRYRGWQFKISMH